MTGYPTGPSASELVSRLLADTSSSEKEKAAEALWRLAGTSAHDLQSALSSGAVGPLVGLLPEPLASSPSNPKISAAALGALASMARQPEARDLLRESGVEMKIAGLLLQAELTVLERTANLAEVLAQDRESRESLRRLGAISALLAMLGSDSAGGVCAAAAALKNLSSDEESKAEIARHDGLEVLVDLLGHREQVAACKAAECIGNFAVEQAYRVRLRSLEAVGPLVHLLRTLGGGGSNARDPRLGPAAALLNICMDDDCKALLLRQRDGIDSLLPLLADGTDPQLRLVAAMTLVNLSRQAECAACIADRGGTIEVARCLEASDAQLREKAAGTLCNLAVHKHSREAVLHANVLQRLLGPNGALKERRCLGALRALSEQPQGRSALIQEGVVAQLLPLLNVAEPEMAEGASEVLWMLCNEEPVRMQVLNARGIPSLISLIDGHRPSLARAVVGLVALLVEHEEAVAQLYEHGAVELFLGLLSGIEEDAPMMLGAVQVLVSLAERRDLGSSSNCWDAAAASLARALECRTSPERPPEGGNGPDQELITQLCVASWLACEGDDARQRAFAEAGGVSALCRVLGPAREDALLETATGAVRAICQGCPSNQESFVKIGGLELLVELLEHRKSSVRQNAAMAICASAEADAPKRRLHELGAVARVREVLGVG